MAGGRDGLRAEDWAEHIMRMQTQKLRKQVLDTVPKSMRAQVEHKTAVQIAQLARDGRGPAAFDLAPTASIEKRAMQLSCGPTG